MSKFSLPLLATKFSDLDTSQESVETISFWMLHHRRHAATIVKYWIEHFNISSDAHKLALLFLVNDILGSNKIKSGIFQEEFEQVLPEALYQIAESCKLQKLLQQTRRLLNIWQNKRYFKKDIIDRFWFSLNGVCDVEKMEQIIATTPIEIENDNPIYRINYDIKPMELKKMFLATGAPEPDELINALESLVKLPSADKTLRTKISNFPIKNVKAFGDRQQAFKYEKKLSKASKLVDDYNERLKAEISQREKLDKMLIAFEASESERILEIEEKILEVIEQLNRTSILRKEIKRHRDSFPDLKKYSKTTELPPLPKAEELFKRQ